MSTLIKLGDIVQLGRHRLLCGDATNTSLVSSFLKDAKIDLLLTDPPYGIAVIESKAYLGNAHRPIANDHLQSEAEYRAFTNQWLTPLLPYLAEKNAYYIFNADKMIFAMKDGLTDAGYKFSQLLVWVKTGAVIGRLDYLPQHELIAYGWHDKHAFLRSADKSVIVHPKIAKNTLHATMKPVPLLRRLILNSTARDAIVYDPFGGSGSTLIACEDTRRTCYMVELDAAYCQVIVDRFERHTGITPHIISHGS